MSSETAIPWSPSLPSSWSVQRAKTLLFREKVLNSDRSEKQVLSLTLRGVVDNDPDNPEGLVPDDYATYQLFEPDDLVFKLIDLENVRTSRVGLVPKRGIMSSAYVRLRPRMGVCVRFLYWSFFDLYNRQVFNHLGSGVRSTLGADDVLNLPLAIPDLATQRRIADYLDTETARIDALIAKKQRMIDLLTARRLSAIEASLGGGMDAASYLTATNRSQLRVVPLKMLLLTTIAGGTPDSDSAAYWTDDPEGIPWVTIGDMVDSAITRSTARRLTTQGLSAARLRGAPSGTLLFAMYASLGKLTVSGVECVWNQAILGLVPDKAKADLEYLALWLEALRPHLSLLARSTTQDNLNAEQVRSFPVPIRSVEEQRKLVSELSPAFRQSSELRQRLEAQIALLHERRQALITAAVTGELEVPGVAG